MSVIVEIVKMIAVGMMLVGATGLLALRLFSNKR